MPSRKPTPSQSRREETRSRESQTTLPAVARGRAPEDARRESGRPGGGQGRTDVVGIIPPGQVHIDPDMTEGHPGYEESGLSESIPIERLESGETREQAASARARTSRKRHRRDSRQHSTHPDAGGK